MGRSAIARDKTEGTGAAARGIDERVAPGLSRLGVKAAVVTEEIDFLVG